MPLNVGDKLGHYEVLSLLGEGGMGEVYKARDTTLKRDVALKVLPVSFLRDPERMARFQREAEVLASLDHPNVGQIYGIVDSEESRGLVLALIEGPTLADQIALGPLPLDDALSIAKQIIEALEYAHDRGVVHRDLKPANIKITPEGVVKVLDFGLAKVLEDEAPPSSIGNSPTLTMGHTRAGVILGTAAYMSPEQAVGRPVDRRTDIFSFGAVLYEMLCGRHAFAGATTPDVLEAVVKNEPDWSALPAGTPRYLRRPLERMLAKDRKQRLQAIGEARIALENPNRDEPGPAMVRSWSRPRWLWPAIAALMTLLAAGVAEYFLTRPARAPLATQFTLLAPAQATFTNPFGAAAISPDGRFVVFGAASGGAAPLLWIRPLDSLAVRPLPGTENGNFPFWSPDSKAIGFFAGGKLKRVEIAGGTALALCDEAASGNGSVGGAWNPEGVILFGSTDGLYRVPSSGGVPTPVTKTDAAQQETGHGFPQFLPDGKRFLYFVEGANQNTEGMYASSLGRPKERTLVVRTASKAVYAPPVEGHPGTLVWLREQTLLAQRFDAANLRLEGDPAPLAEDISLNDHRAAFWTSDAGLLVFRTGGATTSKPVWIARDGKRLGEAAAEEVYGSLRLSPDGKRVAIGRRLGSAFTNEDLWLLEFARNIWTRFTFDPRADRDPVWSPDGRQLAFTSNRSGTYQIYRKDAGGAGQEEQLTSGSNDKYVTDWSRDGRYLFYSEYGPKTGSDLWALPLEGERKPVLVVQTQFTEYRGRFSPDGRWVAYVSTESGQDQVYIQAFPGAPSGLKGKWQVSSRGGLAPAWRGDGQELFFLTRDGKMMAANIRFAAGVEVETPRELFGTPAYFIPSSSYDVTADGQRFLVEEVSSATNEARLTVLVRWQAGLK